MSRTGRRPHHAGSFQVRSAALRRAAYGNPATRCWRCRLTMAEILVKHPKARWTAGHLIDGQIGGQLAPECSPCNFSAGASMGNRLRKPRPNPSRQW